MAEHLQRAGHGGCAELQTSFLSSVLGVVGNGPQAGKRTSVAPYFSYWMPMPLHAAFPLFFPELVIVCVCLPRCRTDLYSFINMLRFHVILKYALVPSILYFLISVVAVALTTHYWILTDWVIPRGLVVVTPEFDDRTQSYVTDATIVYFTDADTDATIVSGCLNLAAAVIALIAWSTLRKPGMDSQPNTVGIPTSEVEATTNFL